MIKCMVPLKFVFETMLMINNVKTFVNKDNSVNLHLTALYVCNNADSIEVKKRHHSKKQQHVLQHKDIILIHKSASVSASG